MKTFLLFGEEALKILEESYERLHELKLFIIQSIEETPFPDFGSELGGRAVGANRSGVRISLHGGRGVMVKPWEQLSARLMIQMAGHYIGTGTLSDREQGDKLLSLSLLCYYNGGFRAAERYAEQAVETDPALKTTTRRLMPSILEN